MERDVERKLGDLVRSVGGRSYKWVSPGNAGVPDRIVVLPGRVIFVELKAEGGALKPIQRLQLQHLDALGQECYVVCGMAGVKLFAEIIGADCSIYTDNEKRSKALERMKEYRHGV